MSDYNAILNQLRENELTEYIVTREEFLRFREQWLLQPDRMNFVGEAGLNGQIIYRYQK